MENNNLAELMAVFKKTGYNFETLKSPICMKDFNGKSIPLEANILAYGNTKEILAQIEPKLDSQYMTIFPYSYDNSVSYPSLMVFRFAAIYKDAELEIAEGRY